jgi:CBS-domain-containing membrane protein
VGAATGIGIALWFVDVSSSPFLLASIGGSTMFLFGLTRAPAAQPRALFGGHLGGALIGVLCSQAFGDALWVYILAVVLTLIFMLTTKTLHPPAGANPLIMVHEHSSFFALWQPVGLSILILALVAVVWSRLVPGMVHYPTKWFDKSRRESSACSEKFVYQEIELETRPSALRDARLLRAPEQGVIFWKEQESQI